MNDPQKNSYVKRQITQALIRLLQDRELNRISICEIAAEAGVARASFYRNYPDKTDVLRQHVRCLTKMWGEQFEKNPDAGHENVFGSLFQHYKDNAGFYLLLYRNGLSELILDTILEVCGPSPAQENSVAYRQAFFAYGLYGWVLEWLARGMKESAGEMDALLAFSGAKPDPSAP